MKVYLAGPINGCTDAQANDWRDLATAALPGCDVLNPMRRDYRGHETEHVAELVEADIVDVLSADVVLVNATRPSWGTAMELVYARDYGVRVVAFGADKPSPWLLYHADEVLPTLTDALRFLTDGAA